MIQWSVLCSVNRIDMLHVTTFPGTTACLSGIDNTTVYICFSVVQGQNNYEFMIIEEKNTLIWELDKQMYLSSTHYLSL